MTSFYTLFATLLLASLAASAETMRADVCTYEATPGGIAMAVRAAREGLSVVLVNHNDHLGGILSSGLGVWDTLWEGKRSPIYDEARQAILDHYRTTYGEDSPQYRDALPGKSGHSNGKFEPKVAESILTAMVTREKNIRLVRGFYPVVAQREGSQLKAVSFRQLDGNQECFIQAKVFVDCSYEGDLAAVAKAPYRIGRESREEFGEPHAGEIFMSTVKSPPTPAAVRAAALHHELNLRKFDGLQRIEPQSTGAADGNVQAFNYRTTLSSDTANRLPVEKPANYDPEKLKRLEFTSIVAPLPNNKRGWNRPQLVGMQTEYVEADWAERQKIMDAFWDATLGMLYFLQNDPSVPTKVKEDWRKYGLAKDEFTDHHHRPYEFYVREARRIKGRYVFTQHDAMLAPGLERAPVHGDSIGVTEWYLDTHACTPRRIPGTLEEGKMMLDVETFPGQVPYRAILPEGVDNLLVPVCLSSTHVAWGTIRLEPTWMNLCESAGHAAALSVQNHVTPATLDPELLLRKLAASHIMLHFFNDLDVASNDPRVPAAQYFGTKGFFASYDAKLDAPLTEAVKAVWQDACAELQKGKLQPMQLVKAVHAAEAKPSPPTDQKRGEFLLAAFNRVMKPRKRIAMKSTLLTVLLLATLATLSASAGEHLFETTCLFSMTLKNKPNYRIPSIIQALNGDLLVICERRNDGIGDIGNHDIVMKRSSDKGVSWSDEILILDDEDRVCTDITLGIDRESRKLWLFFLKDKKQFAYLTSVDSGVTWHGPVVIHDQVTRPEWQMLPGKDHGSDQTSKSRSDLWEKGWVQRYGCGPGNTMIQLKSGRLLVPARHREDIGNGRLRSFSHCFYSDDHGATWKLGGTIGINTSECQFVELNDGSVRAICRNESSEDSPDNLRHLTAISKDGGETWSEPQRLEELITPRCHGCVERYDAKRLLFSSPASPFRQKEHPYGRYNLTIRTSLDDGRTWTAGRTVWPHPGSYSDMVVLDDQTIGYVYERADKGSDHYWDELHFVRFNLEWLANGKAIMP